MDESREDIPRISVDSLGEWHRIKANFTNAVLDQFDQRVREAGLQSERATLLPHVQQVCIYFIFLNPTRQIPYHVIPSVYRYDFRKSETQCTDQWKEIRGFEGSR
jgi:hypothetical protein